MKSLENFKNIHIGNLIRQRVVECDVDIDRICNFLKISEDEVENMYTQKSIDSEVLLRWCKLLDYDFFRIYTQHLILYSPQDPNVTKRNEQIEKKSGLPRFKKNIYTNELIMYLIELVESGEKTSTQIQKDYNIPKTTILRWVDKYGKSKSKDP